ncbi:signal peptidase II [bacterium]|nr:signal peptidase II [bacterium]
MIAIFALLSLISDQLVKFLLERFLPDYVVITSQTLVFSNTAAGVISVLFLVLLFGLYWRDRDLIESNLWASLGMGFCFGGAVSNLVDRLTRGGVLDFGLSSVRSNLADILLLVGLFLLFGFYFSRKDTESV